MLKSQTNSNLQQQTTLLCFNLVPSMEDGTEKVLVGDDEDQKRQDVEEERNVEKFFELIRNLRDARNRLMIKREMVEKISSSSEEPLVSTEDQKNKKKRKIMKDMNWVPSFEKEDFTADIEFRPTPSIFPSPCNIKDKRHVKKGGLDLNLTL